MEPTSPSHGSHTHRQLRIRIHRIHRREPPVALSQGCAGHHLIRMRLPVNTPKFGPQEHTSILHHGCTERAYIFSAHHISRISQSIAY